MLHQLTYHNKTTITLLQMKHGSYQPGEKNNYTYLGGYYGSKYTPNNNIRLVTVRVYLSGGWLPGNLVQ